MFRDENVEGEIFIRNWLIVNEEVPHKKINSTNNISGPCHGSGG
jgi:hypothetical protein